MSLVEQQQRLLVCNRLASAVNQPVSHGASPAHPLTSPAHFVNTPPAAGGHDDVSDDVVVVDEGQGRDESQGDDASTNERTASRSRDASQQQQLLRQQGIHDYCKKLNSLKHLVRTTVAELHN